MSNTNENLTPAQIAAAEAAAVQMASMTSAATVEAKKSYRPSWRVIVGAVLGTAVVGGGMYFAMSKAKANRRAAQDGTGAQAPQDPGMN